MKQIEIGSTVQLASGGLLMTVESFIDSVHAQCVWFDNDGVFHTAALQSRSLHLVKFK